MNVAATTAAEGFPRRAFTWVHTGPSGEQWSSIVERGPDDVLAPSMLPGFSIRLGELD